jgi:hypothetical protein
MKPAHEFQVNVAAGELPEGRSFRQRGVEVVWQLAQMVPVPLAPFTGGELLLC